eukprot:6387039-Ditylum_brightwellii.AAC.1
MFQIRLLILSALVAIVASFAPPAFVSTRTISTIKDGVASSASSSLTSLDAYKKVFVAGGSKGVGRHIVDKLIEDGSEVVALVRSQEAIDEL